MTSLIVKPTGIHVSDGSVEILCADQEQAAALIWKDRLNVVDDHPYPIPNLRFTVKVDCAELCHGTCYECHHLQKVAILSLEERKEERVIEVIKCKCGSIFAGCELTHANDYEWQQDVKDYASKGFTIERIKANEFAFERCKCSAVKEESQDVLQQGMFFLNVQSNAQKKLSKNTCK